MQIARDTWRFYAADVDPNTHLPMDNFGANGVGTYTSAANIGVYLWAVVAARDLGLVSRPRAYSLIRATLTEVQGLEELQGLPLPVVRHHHGHDDQESGRHPLLRGYASNHRQLLLCFRR